MAGRLPRPARTVTRGAAPGGTSLAASSPCCRPIRRLPGRRSTRGRRRPGQRAARSAVESLAMASIAANMAGDAAARGGCWTRPRPPRTAWTDLGTGPIAVLRPARSTDSSTAISTRSGPRPPRRPAQPSEAGDLLQPGHDAAQPGLRRADRRRPGARRGRGSPSALRIARQLDDRVAQFHLLGALGCHAGLVTAEPRLAAQLFGAAGQRPAPKRAPTSCARLAPLLARTTAAVTADARARPVRGRVRGRPAAQPRRGRGPRARRARRPSRPRPAPPRLPAGRWTAGQARGRRRPAGRRGPDQQGDRQPPVHLRAHRGQPRPQHPEQARLQLTGPDRRLDGRPGSVKADRSAA